MGGQLLVVIDHLYRRFDGQGGRVGPPVETSARSTKQKWTLETTSWWRGASRTIRLSRARPCRRQPEISRTSTSQSWTRPESVRSAVSFSGPGCGETLSNIAVGPQDAIYVLLTFCGTLTARRETFPSRGASGVLVARLSGADGTVTWARAFGGPGQSYISGITVRAERLLVSVYAGSSTDLGGGLLTCGINHVVTLSAATRAYTSHRCPPATRGSGWCPPRRACSVASAIWFTGSRKIEGTMLRPLLIPFQIGLLAPALVGCLAVPSAILSARERTGRRRSAARRDIGPGWRGRKRWFQRWRHGRRRQPCQRRRSRGR